MAIALYDKVKNLRLFEITEAERDQLVAALEEESSTDHDYYIDANVLDFLEDKCDGLLVSKLRTLVGRSAPAPEGTELAVEGDAIPEVEDAEIPGLDIEWRVE